LTDGKLLWGDGTNALDTNLYRNAANVLKTDDAFICAGLTVNGNETINGGQLTINRDSAMNYIAQYDFSSSQPWHRNTLLFGKGRGTATSPLAVATGDSIFSLESNIQYDSTPGNLRYSTGILGMVSNFTDLNTISTYISFEVMNASNNASEVFRVAGTGCTVTGTIQATGYKSSDGSAGVTDTITTTSLVGKTVTIKNGIITSIA
jgi:hypothetical protein